MDKATTELSCSTNSLVNLLTLIILFSSLLLSAAGQAADPVGMLKFVRGEITIESTSGETRKATKGDDLMQDELIMTGAASIAVIQLNDNSRMTLRPDSEFRVNLLGAEDGSNSSSSQPGAILSLLRGGLRLITGFIGKLNPDGYRLKTPVATIGIRGTEFSTRICISDCAAEERMLAGSEAAAKVNEGLYVNVEEGQVFLENGVAGETLDLRQGESGYVADLTSQPVKLSSVPAFQSLDKIPSPSQLDFGNIQISDDAMQAMGSVAGVAVVAAAAVSAAKVAEVAPASASEDEATELDISGTYEAEVSYGKDLPNGDRIKFFGNDPDLEFTLSQKGDKIKGEFSGDRDGTFKGKIDDNEVTFEFELEARRGELKVGTGTWIVQDDDSLKGDFEIRDPQEGIVRGLWILTKIE